MKKSIFNLMTAAVALGTLASCSDELIEKSGLTVKDGDLVAQLPILTDGSANTRVAKIDGGSFVWDADDQIQVYQLSSLTYSTYNLTGGEGSEIGVFEKTTGDSQSGGDLYAVTQPKNSETIYGISSDKDGNAVLTATIKNQYDWETIESAGNTAYKVPTPFWGKASITGNNISVNFNSLTGFMKITLSDLPENTKSIVLTTHEDFTLDDDFSDANPAVRYTDGKNQPLSGTLRATLKDATSKLEVDERLAKYDYIRVDLENIVKNADDDYVIYIPVVAQTYETLYVLAVTDFGRASYTYEGEILRKYEDYDWEVGKVRGFSLTDVIDLNGLGATSFLEASQFLAMQMLADQGKHTMRVTMDPAGWVDDKLYIGNNLKGGKVSSLEINFTTAVPANFAIEECPIYYNGEVFGSFTTGNAITADKAATLESDQMQKKNTVRVNFEEANGGPASIILPNSYVEVSSAEDQIAVINIFAAPRAGDGVSGRETTNDNKKDASIVIKGGQKADGTPVDYTSITVLENSRGDVYVTEADTYVRNLTFQGSKDKGNLRITDALVRQIDYSTLAGTSKANVYTTGAAAIGEIIGVDNNKVAVYAYWTGKALSDNALAKGFDQASIFTAAQLQGVGLAAGLNEGGGAFTFADGTTLPALTAVYEYEIDSHVSSIWLGGEEYPWLGAQVGILKGGIAGAPFTDRSLMEENDVYNVANKLSQPVSIDGKNVQLRNLKMSITDPYFEDPHVCCTTCGDYSVKVLSSLGLVRSILTTGTVDVKNIDLNDVLLESTYKINDIASIVGTINADGAVTLDNNKSMNIRIDAVGDNIGGQYGAIVSTAGVTLSRDLVGQEVKETGTKNIYVISKGSNVGGVAGRVSGATVIASRDIVHLYEVSGTEGSNVGGLIGNNAHTGNLSVSASEVNVDKIFATQKKSTETYLKTTGNNVGGMIGSNVGTGFASFTGVTDKVEVDSIIAENQCVGGLVGYSSVDGSFQIARNLTADAAVDVKVKTLLQAHNGYAGGLVGYDSKSSATYIGKDGVSGNAGSITVELADIEGAFAVGGLVGSNATVTTISAKDQCPITVTINGVANTWLESDFTSVNTYKYLNLDQSERYKNCGTFGTLVGLKNSDLTVNGKNKIAVSGSVLNNTDSQAIIADKHITATPGMVISNAKKGSIFFKLHSDTGNTVGVDDDKFWGDVNGYLGYDRKGTYKIDGTVQGDQVKNVKIQY